MRLSTQPRAALSTWLQNGTQGFSQSACSSDAAGSATHLQSIQKSITCKSLSVEYDTGRIACLGCRNSKGASGFLSARPNRYSSCHEQVEGWPSHMLYSSAFASIEFFYDPCTVTNKVAGHRINGFMRSRYYEASQPLLRYGLRNFYFHTWHHRRRRRGGKSSLASNFGSSGWQACSSYLQGQERRDILALHSSAWVPRHYGFDNGSAHLRQLLRNCIPRISRDTPPRRDTGIASEQDWGISLKNQPNNESGLNEDGSTWYRESGEDLGEKGYRCRWTVMGGRNADGTVEWKETWWEKSDWTGYKELGAEKSGRNAQGDSWWETWQEIFRQDEWSGLARIEKSAHKQAKSHTGGVWNEKWWEKYNAKGWTEKGAHKYGRLNDQSWWEKWGEQYDGRGAVVKWTDKWAESDAGTKWGDKWEERFDKGSGTRQGETWHVAPSGDRWSRTWGEEHFGNGEVHKYGRSTSGELWDAVVKEPTYYEAEPHYGWAEAIANSLQLLAIEIREKPQGPSVPPPPSPPPPPAPPSPSPASSPSSTPPDPPKSEKS